MNKEHRGKRTGSEENPAEHTAKKSTASASPAGDSDDNGLDSSKETPVKPQAKKIKSSSLFGDMIMLI